MAHPPRASPEKNDSFEVGWDGPDDPDNPQVCILILSAFDHNVETDVLCVRYSLALESRLPLVLYYGCRYSRLQCDFR